jgi:hypothetical protein
MGVSDRPTGATITVVAVVLAVSGVLRILVGTEALSITDFGLAGADAVGVSAWASVIGGVLSILVAGGTFILAGWAWTLAVVVLVVRIVVDLIAVVTHGPGSTLGVSAITNLVISALLLWYFQRASVKSAFGR